MCTRILSFLGWVVQILLVLDGVNIGLAQSRCTKTETTYSPYRELVHDTVILTKKNWFGRVTRYSSPISFYVTKYKNVDMLVEICCPGYSKDMQDICKPICFDGCPQNGFCDTPGHCSCITGYMKEDDKCVPECQNTCTQHEHCSGPNKCQCNEGYERSTDNSSECVPVCSAGCPEHELCTGPNTCDCQPGYRRRDDDVTNDCVPHCVIGCPEHELCTGPNTCDCQPGYMRRDTNQCLPVCTSGCPANSFCADPEHCSCFPGYAPIENVTLTSCQPLCIQECPEHSACLAPNQCECLDGYKMRLRSNGTKYCEPQCDHDCSEYGQCTAPNKCSCYNGYESRQSTDGGFSCQPKCSEPCENGFCFAPETCVCNVGYMMGPHHKCQPQCTHDCINGECVEPEICACKSGYNFQNNSFHICEPTCEPPCIHAECVAPNTCFCRPNHEPSSLQDPAVSHICVPITTTMLEMSTTTTVWETTEIASSSTNTDESTESETTEMFETFKSSTMSVLIMPAETCQTQCKCWRSMNSSDDKCAHICLDDNDQPCLNVSQCYCIERPAGQLHLVCGATDVDNDSDRYKCKMRVSVSTPPSSHENHVGLQTVQHSREYNLQWLVIAVSVAAVTVIVAAVLYVSVRRCRNIRKESTGEESQAIHSYDVIYTRRSD